VRVAILVQFPPMGLAILMNATIGKVVLETAIGVEIQVHYLLRFE
jgi:hypothetical protein